MNCQKYTHHTEIKVVFNPSLPIHEFIMKSHDIKGIQRIHYGGTHLWASYI